MHAQKDGRQRERERERCEPVIYQNPFKNEGKEGWRHEEEAPTKHALPVERALRANTRKHVSQSISLNVRCVVVDMRGRIVFVSRVIYVHIYVPVAFFFVCVVLCMCICHSCTRATNSRVKLLSAQQHKLAKDGWRTRVAKRNAGNTNVCVFTERRENTYT